MELYHINRFLYDRTWQTLLVVADPTKFIAPYKRAPRFRPLAGKPNSQI